MNVAICKKNKNTTTIVYIWYGWNCFSFGFDGMKTLLKYTKHFQWKINKQQVVLKDDVDG